MHIPDLLFALGILGLFVFNRSQKAQTSKALLIPFAWLVIASSRNVGEWLQVGGPSQGGDPYLEGNPLDRDLLSCFIFLGLTVLVQRRKRVVAILEKNLPILIYFSYCAVSLLWSDYPAVGFKRWVRSLGDVIMVLIVLTERNRFVARKQLYAWVGFLVLPLSILLIRFHSELGRTYSIWDGAVFWTGVTTTKNELGMISALYGLASLSFFLDEWQLKRGSRRIKRFLAYGAVTAIAIYLLDVAHSATSLACFLLGTGLLLITRWRPVLRKPALVHLVVGTILLVSFSALFLGIGSSLVEDLGRNSTLTGRTLVWSHVQRFVDSPVFGAGFESFWIGPRLEKMRAFAPGLNQAHNGYLEIYLNLGWVGIILLALLIVIGYRNIFALFRRDPDAARLSLVYFVLALAYNFTESAFKMRSPVWISFLIASLAVPFCSIKKSPASSVKPTLDHSTGKPSGFPAPVLKEYV